MGPSRPTSGPSAVRGIGSNTAHPRGPLGAITGSLVLTALVNAGVSMTVATLCAGSLGLLGSAVVMPGTRRTAQDLAARAASEPPLTTTSV